jgi:hypothetical protein
MESEKLVKQTMKVFSEIEKKLVNPTFRFSQGGSTAKVLTKFIGLFEKEFGAVTKERLVDFCICTAHAYKGRGKWTINQAFGPASIKRLKESKRGARYYEDKWLEEGGLTREALIKLIADRSEHPLSRYIFQESEEQTKLRLLNRPVGFVICQQSTLGWSPLSAACGKCNFIEQCKKETDRKYPELFRIRVEYVESNK